jgi:hypothetical protein
MKQKKVRLLHMTVCCLFSYRHIEYPSYVAVTVMEMNFERIDINQCPLGK